MRATLVGEPGATGSNMHYCTNRQPLLPNPMVKLPLGSVRAAGWLEHQLELMVRGLTGRLNEVSWFLHDGNGWLGSDEQGWEEQPYWIRGLYPLAALTGDKDLLAEAQRWIEAVINNQDEDGYFGPSYNKSRTSDTGHQIADLWPNMLMLDALIEHYEFTGDERVIPMLQRYMAFCRDLPEEKWRPRGGYGRPVVGISVHRAGDMLPQIHWLYNHTGDDWLLDLATRIFHMISPPAGNWLDTHVVHFAQRYLYSGSYYAQSKQKWHLAQSEYWYQQHMLTWGQQPRGIFGADERSRDGKNDPRQGFETCGMLEFAKDFYILGRITGDNAYADRAEDIMLNHFPATHSPDLKGLHYLTASNQPQLDRSTNHDFRNEQFYEHEEKHPFNHIIYSPFERYRCCQHNAGIGWPWYVENLWQGTADNGVAAWMYGASVASAKVGESGREIAIHEETDYPFSGKVSLRVEAKEAVEFPLYLRVPGWCSDFSAAVNSSTVDAVPAPGMYVKIERLWQDGDTVTLDMPMQISLTQWPRTGSVTVDRGPLSYSIRIGEQWQRVTQPDGWVEAVLVRQPDRDRPAYAATLERDYSDESAEWTEQEVLPTTPWNYGLVIDREDPAASLKTVEKGLKPGQPWTVENAPVEIRAKAKRIPNWKLKNEMVPPLQTSPIRSDEQEEEITLIPLGCARLRMACLPVIGSGPTAREWR